MVWHPVKLCRASQITRRTRPCIEKLFKILAARVVLAMEGLEGPNTQDRAGRLKAATGHLFEEMMATYHSLGIAGKVAGKIIQHPVGFPTTLEETW